MKPVVLLLHGALGSIEQFDELRQLLSDDFDVHAFNFSGHGGLQVPDEFSIASFVTDTLSYIQSNSLNSVNVFGYSMGGYVALSLASHYPGVFQKIMTLGTKFDWTKESAGKEVKMLNPDIIEEKVPKFAASLAQRHAPQDWKEVMKKTGDMMIGLGNGKAIVSEDFRKINADVLICLGSEDNMVTRAESEEISRQLPKCRFEIIEGFKHPIETLDKQLLSEKIINWF